MKIARNEKENFSDDEGDKGNQQDNTFLFTSRT